MSLFASVLGKTFIRTRILFATVSESINCPTSVFGLGIGYFQYLHFLALLVIGVEVSNTKNLCSLHSQEKTVDLDTVVWFQVVKMTTMSLHDLLCF